MPNNYFENYPKTLYKKPINDFFDSGIEYFIDVEQVDLYLKFKVREAVLQDTSLFYPYRWKDSDTPWTFARKYYGDEQYHWVVFYSNNAFDFAYDFPFNADNFDKFLIAKYRDQYIESVGSDLSSFVALSKDRQISLVRTYLRNEVVYYEIDDEFQVDLETFNSYNGTKRIVSVYDFEDETNEAKREIQVLDNEYLKNIIKDFKSSMSTVKATRIVG